MILRNADLTFIGPESRAITATLEETGIVLDYEDIFLPATFTAGRANGPGIIMTV